MFLLVNPPGTCQGPHFDIPTNILYLLAALREAGVPCDWVDGNMVGMNGVKDKVVGLRPEFVGISCLSPARFNALEIARFTKEQGARTILGNHHAHWMWQQVLDNYGFVDAIVFSEGERAIVDLATKPWGDVLGIAYRLEPGHPEYVKNEARPHVANLDDIAYPAWDEVDWAAYKEADAMGPRVFYSRGCTGRCKFCNAPAFWRGYRHRSPVNFCDELEWLFNLGQPAFIFGDDNATGEGAMALFTEIYNRRGRIALPLVVTTRADAISVELCGLMRDCGVAEVCLGVESGSQRLMDHMRKDITVEMAEHAIRTVKAAGLKATALLIRNTIGETAEDRRDTALFCDRAKPDAIGGVDALWLYPHTTYYNEVRAGKYDHLITSGDKGLVDDGFFLAPQFAQHVIAWRDGEIFPMRVTEHG
jgi:radical SAM superfamily enzyme YgiQ (UPF0313 family)